MIYLFPESDMDSDVNVAQLESGTGWDGYHHGSKCENCNLSY